MDGTRYSPRLRTGVVLGGTGTAGAYQAGVLHALTEAGIKIDVVAAHGIGAATALLFAVDGGARLWAERGPWSSRRLRLAYRWRPALRTAGLGLAAALALMLSPLLVLALAAAVYALSSAAALINLPSTSARLVEAYGRTVAFLFDPPVLPTIVPRAVVLALLVVTGVIVVAAVRAMRSERSRRHMRGAFWWRLLGAPLDATEPGALLVETLWQHIRGASATGPPPSAEIGHRYVELLADNFGQPAFHEVVLAVHDVDARRDLIGAVLGPASREAFVARESPGIPRESEAVDFTGPQRGLLVDFLAGALRLPVATAPHAVSFATESYWRGDRHTICDRPELLVRLVDELVGIGVEQLILVSPAPSAVVPHSLRRQPAGLRGRVGAVVRSIETAALDDAVRVARSRLPGVFVIRPDHNPVGPFDFGPVYDEASDRERPVGELVRQGYEDAYRQLVEPLAAALDDETE